MKKFLLIFTSLLALACSKQPTGVVTVRFDFVIEQGAFPTKAIADDIMSTVPSALDLVLTGSDGHTFNATTGQEITIPVGTYTVTGGHNPSLVQNIAQNTRYTTKSPIIEVNTSVTIEEGVTSYQVQGSYKSFAVCVLPSEVASWKAAFTNGTQEVDCVKTSDLWFVFVTGNLTGAMSFITTLTSPTGQSKEYTLYTNPNDTNGIRAYYGKWYLLHPFTYQTGSIGLSLPEWESGL